VRRVAREMKASTSDTGMLLRFDGALVAGRAGVLVVIYYPSKDVFCSLVRRIYTKT